jgi:hypothetical protein
MTPRFHAASLTLHRNVSVEEVGLVSGSLESRSRRVWRWEEEADEKKKKTANDTAFSRGVVGITLRGGCGGGRMGSRVAGVEIEAGSKGGPGGR